MTGETEDHSSEPYLPKVGEVIVVADEYGKLHDALVTIYFGGSHPDMALNCVYVSDDESKDDPYGRQLERLSSVSRQREGVTAHGRYWNPKI